MRGAGVGAPRFGEREAVHFRHLDIGDDEIETPLRLQRLKRLRGRSNGNNLTAGGLDERRQHVAEEDRVVDQEHPALQLLRRQFAAAEPVGERLRQEMADVDDLGRVTLALRGAEYGRGFAWE